MIRTSMKKDVSPQISVHVSKFINFRINARYSFLEIKCLFTLKLECPQNQVYLTCACCDNACENRGKRVACTL